MSDTVVVTSDVVVPCNGQAGPGQKAATKNPVAGVTVAFADTAPMVKVREELDAEAGTANTPSKTDESCLGNLSQDASTPVVPSLADASEVLLTGGHRPAVAGHGLPSKPNAEGLTPVPEPEVAVVMAEAGAVAPGTAPVETTSGQDTVAAEASEIATASTASPTGTQKDAERVLFAGETASSAQAVPADASHKSGSDKSTPQVCQTGAVFVPVAQDSVPTNGAVESASSVQIGLPGSDEETAIQIDPSGSAIAGGDVVEAVVAPDNNGVSDVSSSGQGHQDAEMASNTDVGSAGQEDKTSEEVLTQVQADISRSESVDSGDRTGQDKIQEGNAEGEKTSPVEANQVVQTMASSDKLTQAIDDAHRPMSESKEPDTANVAQGVSADPTSRTHSSEVTVGQVQHEADAAQPLAGSATSGGGESSGMMGTGQHDSAMSVQIAQMSKQSEDGSETDSRDAASVTSEATAQVEDVHATVSNRPMSSLGTFSEATAAPFRDPTESVTQQLADSINVSLGRGEKEVVIRLNPPELGSVTVRLEERGDVLSGVLEVSKSETRREIEQALPQVIHSLQEAGVQVRRLDLTVAHQFDRGFDRGQLQQDGSSQQGWHGQKEESRPWSGSDFPSTGGVFEQGMGESMPAGEALGDWSRDRIDMLI